MVDQRLAPLAVTEALAMAADGTRSTRIWFAAEVHVNSPKPANLDMFAATRTHYAGFARSQVPDDGEDSWVAVRFYFGAGVGPPSRCPPTQKPVS